MSSEALVSLKTGIDTAEANALSLVVAAQKKTGISDPTLTAAVQRLINGYGQGSAPNLQEKILPNITANGTFNVTPDAGYDGLSSVKFQVDVPTGGGGEIETQELTLEINCMLSSGLSFGLNIYYVGIKDGLPFADSWFYNASYGEYIKDTITVVKNSVAIFLMHNSAMSATVNMSSGSVWDSHFGLNEAFGAAVLDIGTADTNTFAAFLM